MHDWTVVRFPLKEITWQKLFAISLQALCRKLNLCQSCRMLSLTLKEWHHVGDTCPLQKVKHVRELLNAFTNSERRFVSLCL